MPPSRQSPRPTPPPPARRRRLLPIALILSLALNLAFSAFAVRATLRRGGWEYVSRRLGLVAKPEKSPDAVVLENVQRSLPILPNEIIFVGDSLVQSYPWAEVWPGVPIRNFGIGKSTSKDVLARLPSVIERTPPAVLVAIGGNDIGLQRPVPDIAADIRAILAELRAALPTATLGLNAVTPRQNPLFRDTIPALNARLKDIAAEHNAVFLDINAALIAPDGLMPQPYTHDGLHLTPAAYAVWQELLADQFPPLRDAIARAASGPQPTAAPSIPTPTP